jgi:hypothetical protein
LYIYNNKDENIFSIASALNGFKPVDEPFDFFVYTPCRPNYNADISKGLFTLVENGSCVNGTLIHFGTECTKYYDYQKIVSDLNLILKHKLRINYTKNKLTFFSNIKFNFIKLLIKIKRKLKR